MEHVGEQSHIKSGRAADDPCATLFASQVECGIGISQNNNDWALLVVVISKKSVDRC